MLTLGIGLVIALIGISSGYRAGQATTDWTAKICPTVMMVSPVPSALLIDWGIAHLTNSAVGFFVALISAVVVALLTFLAHRLGSTAQHQSSKTNKTK